MVVNSYITIPLIDRNNVDAKIKSLNGPNLTPFDEWSSTIADWTKSG
jgi:hypothetical protein